MKTLLVKFKTTGKIYQYTAPMDFKVGERVLIETEQGLEVGTILKNEKTAKKQKDELDIDISEGQGVVLRKMTPEDEEKERELKKKAEPFISFCAEKIKELRLAMKLINGELSLDEKKITFYFVSAERIDFRELLQELISCFHKNIRLQQLGSRDAAKFLGGIGPCGRPLCCQSFLENMESVTLEMAKEQDLASSGTSKISGVCGKLICCLSYEAELYQKMRKNLPAVGTETKTEKGLGRVIAQNVLKQTVLVELKDGTKKELKIGNF